MSDWTPLTVKKWLNAHQRQWVVLYQKGSSIWLRFKPDEVETLDACSAEVVTCDGDVGLENAHAALSLHDTGVAVQLILQQQQQTLASVTQRVPYTELVLMTEEAHNTRNTPAPSPYELLH